ncbi:MAG: hypothetical protein ABIT37_03505 [Luteolibacter sp.]
MKFFVSAISEDGSPSLVVLEAESFAAVPAAFALKHPLLACLGAFEVGDFFQLASMVVGKLLEEGANQEIEVG